MQLQNYSSMNKENKELYKAFMLLIGKSETTINRYISALEGTISEQIRIQNYNFTNLFLSNNIDDLENYYSKLMVNENFLELDGKVNRAYSSALLSYISLFKVENLLNTRKNNLSISFNNNNTDILQIIFFGSPGTGKSREVENRTQGHSKTRTTFHPETDYHSFVGSYKPVMNGSNIEYKFVPQAFTKAYCEALKNPNEPHFLIIEEINRGNCAQIFGDIFQCLDRDETGKSKYEVDCNEDLANYLKEVFAETDIVTDKIILPNNLYILATMNTSDQSLFPMDSAFKRRWDWEFVPINYEDANSLNIVVGDSTYNWGHFIEVINPKIKELTGSEDKQLGNRFVNPQDGNITFDQFRSKVLFYLWSEVYKDEYGTQNSIFKYEENGETKDFQFGELYNDNSTEKVKAFLTYNAIEAV